MNTTQEEQAPAVSSLVERAQRGDADAFDELVRRYQDAIFGAAYAMLGNKHDAEDAAQHTFIQAWRQIHSLRAPERFPAWLYRIVQNRCRSQITRRGPATVPLEKLDHLTDQTGEEVRTTAATVRAAIAQLSEPNRLATTLHYIGGYGVAEVAGLLDVPVGTVKRRLHDSRRQLHASMIDFAPRALGTLLPSHNQEFVRLVSLVNAAWTGDLARVRSILGSTPTLVDVRDGDGWTPLHHAARHGHTDIVRLLLDHHADPQPIEMEYGWTPLHLAIEYRHGDIVSLLAESGAELGMTAAAGVGDIERVEALLNEEPARDRVEKGSGPLHWAARGGHRAVIETLLAGGVDVNSRSRNQFGNTALHVAAMRRQPSIVALLLDHGADPRSFDAAGATPLHALAKYPQPLEGSEDDVVSMLIEGGADIKAANSAGETALHWAATRGSKGVGAVLLDHGATLDIHAAAGLAMTGEVEAALCEDPSLLHAPGPDGMTALHFAAYGDAPETAALLLDRGADLEARGGWFGGTPLHLAAFAGRRRMVELMLARGADPAALDGEGWTALHQFRFPWWTPPDSDREGIARALLAAGANVNAQNYHRETPLHTGAAAANESVVKLLLSHHADPNIRDAGNQTPLLRARARNGIEIARLLGHHVGAHCLVKRE